MASKFSSVVVAVFVCEREVVGSGVGDVAAEAAASSDGGDAAEFGGVCGVEVVDLVVVWFGCACGFTDGVFDVVAVFLVALVLQGGVVLGQRASCPFRQVSTISTVEYRWRSSS